MKRQATTFVQAYFIPGKRSGTLPTGISKGAVTMIRLLTIPLLLLFVAGCNPTVKLEAPKEPIEINLNVKIEHNIRVQVDQELEDLFDEESDIF